MITIFSVCHDTQAQGGGIELHASALGHFRIDGIGEPGRERAEFATCPVPDVVFDKIYVGGDAPDGNTYRLESIPGRKHAEAIVASCQLGGGGVAIAEGEVPRPDEVQAAQERYYAWLGQMLQLGQQLWAENRNPSRIPHFSKVAALALGVDVDWMPPAGATFKKRCGNCDTMIPRNAAWCPTCNFVFDSDRAKQGGHLPTLQAAHMAAETAAREETADTPQAAVGGKGSRR